MNAWNKLSQLKDLSKFRPWLCSIARNNIRDYLKKSQRDIIAGAKPMENINDMAADESGPLESAIKKEHETLVSDAIQQVPEQYREPMVLYYRQQQSVKQVALSLDLSEDVVKQRLQRGRKMIREQLSSIVEETLSTTGPKKAFTTAVIASIAGMAIKGTGVAATAGIATVSSTTGTTTGLAAVMSGVTAKIITAAAIVAIGVGAVVTYKHITKPNQTSTPLPTAIVAEKEDDAKSTNEQNKTVEIATSQATEMPDNSISTQIADVVDSPTNLSEETKPPVISTAPDLSANDKYNFVPKGVLSGLITDKDTGEPVVEAEIVVYGASIPSGTLVTDVNGFYSLEKIENSKPYMIVIDSKDYIGKPDIDDNYKISIEKDKQQIAHFQLEKACIADLWVKDEQGNPIEGAKIKVVDHATNRSTAASRSNTIKPTDKDGYTLIGGHPLIPPDLQSFRYTSRGADRGRLFVKIVYRPSPLERVRNLVVDKHKFSRRKSSSRFRSIREPQHVQQGGASSVRGWGIPHDDLTDPIIKQRSVQTYNPHLAFAVYGERCWTEFFFAG